MLIRHVALESVERWKQLIMLLSLSVSRLLHRRTTQECHGCALGGRRVYKKWLKRNRTKASVMFSPCSTVWVRCNIVCFMLWHTLISPLLWCFWQQQKKKQRNKKPTSETVTMVVAVINWQKKKLWINSCTLSWINCRQNLTLARSRASFSRILTTGFRSKKALASFYQAVRYFLLLDWRNRVPTHKQVSEYLATSYTTMAIVTKKKKIKQHW